MIDIKTLDWPNIAFNPNFRKLPQQQKDFIKQGWFQYLAPQIHPGYGQDTQITNQVLGVTSSLDLPAPLKSEGFINDLTKNSGGILTADILPAIEHFSDFKRSNFNDQQQLRYVAFQRMRTSDPEFMKLKSEEQQAFFDNWMKRAPSLSGMASKLIGPMDPLKMEDNLKSMKVGGQAALDVMNHLVGSFAKGVVWPVTAVRSLIGGSTSQLQLALQDADKVSDWIAMMREGQKGARLEEGLSSFVGGVAAIAMPGSALGGMIKGLSGAPREIAGAAKLLGATSAEMKSARALEGALGSAPGLLEKAGRGIGLGGSPIIYKTIGDTLSGAVMGVGMALSEGKKWSTYLPQDIALGLVTGGLSRYMSQVWSLRKAAKLAGMDPAKLSTLFKTPFDPTKPMQLPAELERIMQGSPIMTKIIKGLSGTDERGFFIGNTHTPEGLNLQAEILGLEWKQAGNKITITAKGKQVGEVVGATEDAARRNLDSWFATSAAADPYRRAANTRAAKVKGGIEQTQTAPIAAMRIGQWIPEQARNYLLDRLYKTSDFRALEGRAGIDQVDEMLRLIKAKFSSKSVATRLNKRFGLRLGEAQDGNIDIKAATAAVDEMRVHLNDLWPSESVIRNGETQWGSLPNDFMHVAFNPAIDANPYKTVGVYVGPMSSLREQLLSIKNRGSRMDTAVSRSATNLGMKKTKTIQRFIDSQVVEFRVPVITPEGTQIIADLHFPNIRDAMKFLNTGDMSDEFKVFMNSPQLREDYQNFMDAIKATPKLIRGKMEKAQFVEEYSKAFMPMKFMLLRAKQDGYNLAYYNGKYVLEDTLGEASTSNRRMFDSMEQVYNFLTTNDTRGVMPDLGGKPGLSQKGVEEITDPKVPLSPLEYETINRNRNFGLRYFMNMKFAPSPYAYQQFERMQGTELFERYGVSPMQFHTDIRNLTQVRDVAMFRNNRYISSIEKGIKKTEAPYIKKYLESVVSQDEINTMPAWAQKFPGYWKFRTDVVQEMTQKFGAERAGEIVTAADKLGDWYKGMFSASGLDWNKWIRRYHPHIVTEMNKRSLGLARVNWDNITSLPDPDKKEIMELFREADPTKMTYMENPFDAARFYANMLIRKVYTRPVMDHLTSSLKALMGNIKKTDINNETLAIMNYYKNTLQTLEGIHGENDRIFQMATEGAFQKIQDGINKIRNVDDTVTAKRIASVGKGVIGKLITLAVGGQLAFRGWPVFKQLTQAFITGGSMIGEGWVMRGFERLAEPGMYERMFEEGIMRPSSVVPVVGGESITQGLGGKVIRTGMKAFSSGDQISRGAVYLGMEEKVRIALDAYRRGAITKAQFINKSGMKLFGKADYNIVAGLFNKGHEDAFVNHLARTATDKTIFLYDRFETATAFRSSFGRLFGQYTHWPINFYTLIKDRLQNMKFSPYQSAMYFARLTATSTAIAAALYEAGVNPREFAPWNNVVMSPGPYAQLGFDMLRALKGDVLAQSNVARTLSSIVPLAYVGGSVYRAAQALGDGDPWEAAIHILSAPPRTDIFPNRNNVGIAKLTENFLKAGFKKINDTMKQSDPNALLAGAGL